MLPGAEEDGRPCSRLQVRPKVRHEGIAVIAREKTARVSLPTFLSFRGYVYQLRSMGL